MALRAVADARRGSGRGRLSDGWATVDVVSVDEVARRVTEAGRVVVVEKMAVPGVGWLIYCSDPGGVLFGCMASDASAA